MALSEFKDVVEDFSDELKGAGYGMEGGMGRGQGNPFDADVLFYMKLAENYSIPLKKFPLEEKGSLHPHSHSSLGDRVTFSRCGYVDQFWEDHAWDHSDLDEKRGEGKGKDRRHSRLLNRHRFFRKHDQSSKEPLLCCPGSSLRHQCLSSAMIQKWRSITSVMPPWEEKIF